MRSSTFTTSLVNLSVIGSEMNLDNIVQLHCAINLKKVKVENDNIALH